MRMVEVYAAAALRAGEEVGCLVTALAAAGGWRVQFLPRHQQGAAHSHKAAALHYMASEAHEAQASSAESAP